MERLFIFATTFSDKRRNTEICQQISAADLTFSERYWWRMLTSGIFLFPNIIAICPRTFSNRVWRSLLMACRKYIQWCISYIKLNHIDCIVSHSWGFLDHTQQHTRVGRTTLDKWSARRRDLYLTTQNTHNKQISMHPVGFEPTILAGERSRPTP